MQHIKNSPNLRSPDVGPPLASIALPHPNVIAKLTPWQLDFRQITPGALQTRLTVRTGSELILLDIAMNGKVHQRGAAPPGWTTFGIPQPESISSWQGSALAPNSLIWFGGSDGFEGVSEKQFQGLVISVPTDRFAALAQAGGFPLPEPGSALRTAPTRQFPQQLAELRRFATALLDPARMAWSAAAEEAVALAALSMLSDTARHRDKSDPLVRRRALNRAIDVMEAHLDDPIAISDLCTASAATWRTLDRAFKDRFGIGPKAYYTRLRLNRVRSDLIGNDGGLKIIDVANRYGFWHMGQFARDYRNLFGQLPSETQPEFESDFAQLAH